MSLNNKMKISVAMCTFNGEDFIAEQIESIINQTVLPDEIIIIDDGSSDKTIDIIKQLTVNNRIDIKILINEINVGVTRNFENAINKCSGDIIFLADQDDVWFSDKIEKMIKPFLSDKNTGLVYCDAIITDSSLTPTDLTVFNTRGKSRIWQGANRDPEDVISTPNIKGCTMAVAARYKSMFLPVEIKSDNKLWGHDHWIAFVLYCISNVKAVNIPLMYYRIHKKNTSGNVQKKVNITENKQNYYKLLYSTSSVPGKIEKYKIMIQFLDKIKNSENIFNKDLFNNYYEILLNEIYILGNRVSIWKDKSIIKKYKLIIIYFFNGGYFHYRHWLISLLKDMTGYGIKHD